MHMQSIPACSSVVMMGGALRGKKKKDNGSQRWISFNKIKTGYWHKDLEGKDLATTGIWPELFLFWKSRTQREQRIK